MSTVKLPNKLGLYVTSFIPQKESILTFLSQFAKILNSELVIHASFEF